MTKTLPAIFVGGGLGSVTRFLVSKMSEYLWPENLFPIGTFISNFISTALLALVVFYGMKNSVSTLWTCFLVIGFCGGFSTFSAFGYETFKLLQMGQWGWAAANVVFSVIDCLIIIY